MCVIYSFESSSEHDELRSSRRLKCHNAVFSVPTKIIWRAVVFQNIVDILLVFLDIDFNISTVKLEDYV